MGDLSDIDKAISVQRAAVNLTPDGHREIELLITNAFKALQAV